MQFLSREKEKRLVSKRLIGPRAKALGIQFGGGQQSTNTNKKLSYLYKLRFL